MTKQISLLPVLFGFAAAALLSQSAASRVPSGRSAAEQRTFSAEDESVRKPIPLTEAMSRLLAKDPDVRETISAQNVSPEKLPTSWFSISEIHLDGPREKDIVIIGKGPMLGANITPFWVFRPVSGGFEQILNTYAHDLSVKSTRSRGYRDIQVMRATAVRVSTTVYKFDGASYKVSTDTSSRVP